jgi:hypothetical protein
MGKGGGNIQNQTANVNWDIEDLSMIVTVYFVVQMIMMIQLWIQPSPPYVYIYWNANQGISCSTRCMTDKALADDSDATPRLCQWSCRITMHPTEGSNWLVVVFFSVGQRLKLQVYFRQIPRSHRWQGANGTHSTVYSFKNYNSSSSNSDTDLEHNV